MAFEGNPTGTVRGRIDSITILSYEPFFLSEQKQNGVTERKPTWNVAILVIYTAMRCHIDGFQIGFLLFTNGFFSVRTVKNRPRMVY